MHTLVTPSPTEAATFIRSGEVAAFPTETVYGLGADALAPRAVERIFVAKGRPADNPLIVHVARIEQIEPLVRKVTPAAERFIEHFFPGPLTVILPRSALVPDIVTGGLGTVGLRMPRHAVAQAFLDACDCPVAAPSANTSGRPSPTTWQAVLADLDGRIPCILRGEQADIGLESTVVDCSGPIPVVLRAGAVTLEQLRDVLPDTRLAHATMPELARSPGTRYRHYAPRARVRIVDDPAECPREERVSYIGLEAPPHPGRFMLVEACASVEAYAHALFHFFRRSDAQHVDTICCRRVPHEGIGRALMDRIERAAKG